MARSAKKWSNDELKQLRRIYPNTPTADVCKELGRSIWSVKCKASSMGLTKTKKYLKSIGRA